MGESEKDQKESAGPRGEGTPLSARGQNSIPEKSTSRSESAQKKKSRRAAILFIAVVVIVAIVLAAYFSITVHQSPPVANASYPWTTQYDVLFPDGKQEHIGSTTITALSYQDEVIIDVDDNRERLVVGEQRLISERRAIITMLGIPIVDTNYQMYVTFIGVRGSDDEFYLIIKTSEQVPQFLIERILPPDIRARPV
ncbi:MAG: hypothetical protein LUO93_11910 [Methanomicrobiales archaeon]|nr:hypothetical protein [Methanomicrobiales archaeon]MDD1679873.1 hypothetical protein [Methanomicrobiales archaeon]